MVETFWTEEGDMEFLGFLRIDILEDSTYACMNRRENQDINYFLDRAFADCEPFDVEDALKEALDMDLGRYAEYRANLHRWRELTEHVIKEVRQRSFRHA